MDATAAAAELVYSASIGDADMVQRSGARFVNAVVRSVGELQLEDHRLLAGRRRKLPTDHRVPPKLRYDHGLTALMAAALGSHSRVVAALQELGADPDARNMQRETALMMAAAKGDGKIVQQLLEPEAADASKPSLDLADVHGFTALMKACHGGHDEVVATLCAHGARVDKRDKEGFTALHLAASRGHAHVLRLLLELGAAPDDRNWSEGATSLVVASSGGHAEAISALLAGGAAVDLADDFGVTPIALAAEHGHAQAVTALLQGKADVDGKVLDGQTPFHLACARGRAEAAAALVRAECDQTTQDNAGRTGLELAEAAGHGRCIREKLEEMEAARLEALAALRPAARWRRARTKLATVRAFAPRLMQTNLLESDEAHAEEK